MYVQAQYWQKQKIL